MTRRLTQLFVGLWLYGATMALLVRAGMGLDPWDVFHEGLTHHLPLTFGQVVILVGALVLLAWIPLRQRPGFGTIANVVVIGLAADATLAVLPEATGPVWGTAMLVAGVVGNGMAGAMYVGAGLGPGPRDGLWTGIVRRTGASVRRVRTMLELLVLATGFVLGGTVGIGTVLYAVAIGPIVQFFLPWFEVRRAAAAEPATT
ncbi:MULTISPECIES: YczE/YyaS/YitT family protein [unclassified Aeromicrobium]|uniref:membrane protein YczE n=1 Tax=unclassified Aeromicrobium TaxID=2633570 RepID=UPI00396AF9B4